jgi:multiple sugar transport system ATP-binding protein
VYVTHDQTEAMTMGDRIAVLRDGRLEQVAPPLTCYHEPATRFVASFIGEPSMNFLDTRFDPGRELFEGPPEYPATDTLAAAAREAQGRAITLGVRPEAVSVEPVGRSRSQPAGDGAERAFPGRVDVVEPVGERAFLYLALDAGPTVTAAVPGGGTAREGTRVRVRLPPDRLHLFDAATGRALGHPDRGTVEATGDWVESRPIEGDEEASTD